MRPFTDRKMVLLPRAQEEMRRKRLARFGG